MNLNSPNRQKVLMIAAGAVVGLLVLDRVVFTPLQNTWEAHSKDITRLQTLVNDGKVTQQRASLTTRRWQEMRANALPKDTAQAEQDVLTAFDRWRSANNMELFQSQRPQWKRGATDKYSLMEFRLDATGTITALSKFIYELEHSPLALRVDSMELSSRDGTGSKLSLALVVSGLRLVPLERTPK